MSKREMVELRDGTVRVESGPARKITVATEEVLRNEVTAEHYRVGEFDAIGQRIVLGEPMVYLDYRSPWVWYVYQLGEIGIDDKGRPMVPGEYEPGMSVEDEREMLRRRYEKAAWVTVAATAPRVEERWVPVGVTASKEEAMELAEALEPWVPVKDEEDNS